MKMKVHPSHINLIAILIDGVTEYSLMFPNGRPIFGLKYFKTYEKYKNYKFKIK